MPHHPSTQRAATTGALFAQICRATPQEARDLSLLLSMAERAALALCCNARTHLRAQGRAIASACSLASLVKEGGQAGLSLFDQAGAAADTWGAIMREGKRPVSLAG